MSESEGGWGCVQGWLAWSSFQQRGVGAVGCSIACVHARSFQFARRMGGRPLGTGDAGHLAQRRLTNKDATGTNSLWGHRPRFLLRNHVPFVSTRWIILSHRICPR